MKERDEPARSELFFGRIELRKGPPPNLVNILGRQVDLRSYLVAVNTNDVVALDLADEVLTPFELVHARPDAGADLRRDAGFLEQLPAQGVLVRFPLSSAPPGVAHQLAREWG